MYKLMVVDDEFSIRDGIMNAVAWRDHGVEAVACASDGREALERFYLTKPDIIITDIHMDDVSGLEFAERIMDGRHNVKIIIISGYDDFDYARKAIELKVFSYLLKPVLPRELLETVNKAIGELKQEESLRQKIHSMEEELRLHSPLLREHLVDDILEGRWESAEELEDRALALDMAFSCPSYALVVFELDTGGQREPGSSGEVYRLILGVKRIAQEIAENVYPTRILLKSHKRVALILGLARKEDVIPGELEGLLERIRDTVERVLSVTVTAGVGSLAASAGQLTRSYREALLALEYRAVPGRNSIIFVQEVLSMIGGGFSYPLDKEIQILEALGQANGDKLKIAVEGFFDAMEGQKGTKNQAVAVVKQLTAAMSRKLSEAGMEWSPEKKGLDEVLLSGKGAVPFMEQARSVLCRLSQSALGDLSTERKMEIRSVIKKAQDYIGSHYADPGISLTSIAAHVYLSPAYFSKMYKEQTGEAYIEYITRMRVDNARRLLTETNMRISDIGAAVGFPNAQYFCTLFKKWTGLSPLDYREGGGPS